MSRSLASLLFVVLVVGGCNCEDGGGRGGDASVDASGDSSTDSGTVDGFVGVAPSATNDAYASTSGVQLSVPAGSGALAGLLVNDTLGSPSGVITSFGGGALGGGVTDHAAGTSTPVGAGSLAVNADGSFTFTSDAAFTGPFSFQYRVENATGHSDATVTIDVSVGPTAVDDSYVTLEATALVVGGSDADALDNNDLGVPAPAITSFGGGDLGGAETDHAPGATVTFGTSGSLVVAADGGFTFTPDVGMTGTFSFDYVVANALGSSVGTATITVRSIPTIAGTPPGGTVGSSYSHAFTVTGFPTPTLSITAGTLPAGVMLVGTTLTGTPTLSGSFTGITITASNGAGNASTTFSIDVAGPPTIVSASGATFTIGTAGSFTVTASAFPIAAITSSGALPSGVTIVDRGDGTATLAGTPDPGTAGTYTLTLTATNGTGAPAMQTFTLTVAEAPTIAGAPPHALLGQAYSHTFTTSGSPAPALTLTSGSLPLGISLAGDSLVGTPTASGSYAGVVVTASNGASPDATLSLTFVVDEAPAITSAASATFVVGAAGTHTVTTTGFPVASITGAGSLPSGVSLVDQADGTALVAGTPTAGTGGSYPITITASNGIGADATQSFTLTVNEAPGLSGAPASGVVGVAYAEALTVSGFPAPTLSVTSGTLPPGLSIVGDSIVGTPTVEGTYSGIELTASNGVGADATLTVAITIDLAPAITSASSTTFTVGAAGTFGVTTLGSPAATLTESGALPSGVTFVDVGGGMGTLSGTPDVGTGGTYTFTLTASNGVGSNATQSFTLTVNEAPSLAGTPAGGTVGSAYSHAFTLGGFPTPTLSVTGGTLPPGLSLVGGGITGVPTAGGNYAGITVTATNGIGVDATITFSIDVGESPAITSAASTNFVVGAPGSFTITTTSYPSAGITRSGALPSGVSLTDNADGTATLAGTPAPGTGGSYPITITASNGVGSNATQSFTLTVNEAPSISGTPAGGTVGTAYNHAFAVSGFPAPTLSVTGGSLPPGLSILGSAIVGTPTLGGNYAGITVTATNGVAPTASINFAIAVGQAPAITSAPTTTFLAGSMGSFIVTTTGYPAATITNGGALPSGVSLVDNGNGTAMLSGTPGAGTGGNYAITITANNGVGSNATQSFTLVVQQSPAISGTPGGGTVGTAYGHLFAVSGFPAPTLSVTGGSLPPGLSISGSSITGTPTLGGNYAGITVTATNGVAPNASISFAIAIGQPPAITSAPTTTFLAGSMGSFIVTTTGYPAAAITRSGALPAGVTLVDNGNGTAMLSGTPGAGTGGNYAFTITANNGVGSNATQSFTLVVQQAPAIAGAPPSGTAGTAYSHAFTVSGFPAPTLSVTGGSLPPGLSIVGNSITGTPTVGGNYTGITVTATNGVAPNASITFSINIVAAPTVTADSYAVTGNVPISVAASGVLGNDTLSGATLTNAGPSAATSSTVPASFNTTNGGTVTVAANGSFTYDPAAGFTGSDQFFYRVTNGAGNAVGTVTLTVTNMIWFVDNTAAAGTGRFSSPFNSLATAVTTSAANQHIFVYYRAGSYTAAVPLKSGQRLIGQGVALGATSLGFTPAPNSVALPAASTQPTIVGTVTFAQTSGVHGVRVAPAAGAVAITDGGVARTGLTASVTSAVTTNAIGITLSTGSGGTLSFRSVDTTGGTNGIRLVGVTGTFTVTGNGASGTGGTLANTTGNSVQITNTTATVSLSYMGITGAVYDMVSAETSGNGIKVDSTGTATANVTVDRCTFSSNGSRAAYVHPTSSGATAFTFTNCTSASNVGGISDVSIYYDGTASGNTFVINNNTFTDVPVGAVSVNVGNSTSALQTASGHINFNNITGRTSGVSAGFASGILTGTGDNAGSTLVEEINNNTFTSMGTMAIDVNHQPLNNNIHATVRNNVVRSPVTPGVNYLYGIRLVFTSTATAGVAQGTMCVNVTGNDIPNFGGGEVAIRFRKLGVHPAFFPRIQGFVGNTQPQLTTFVQTNNAGPFGLVQYSPDPVTVFDFANATCQIPP